MSRSLETLKRSDVPEKYLQGFSMRNLYFLTFVDWTIIFLCTWLIFNTSPYLYPLWILIIGGRFHAFGVILHDLTHANFKNKTIGMRIIEVLAGYPIGTSINAMAYHHVRHHRYTLMENDPYFNHNKKCSTAKRVFLTLKKGPLIGIFWVLRSFVGVAAYYMKSLRTSYARIFLQDVSGKDLSDHPEVELCCKEDRYLAFIQTLIFISAFYYAPVVYIYYVGMTIGGIFGIYRLLIEHEYDIVEDRKVYTMIECTFDHHLNLWGKAFFAPHKIGYHCMHHIHPSVGLQHLPKLRNWYLENSVQYKNRYIKGNL